MSNALQKYFRRLESRRAENTVSNRKVAIRQFFEWKNNTEIDNIEDYDPTELNITTIHIEDFMDYLLADGYAKRSVQDKLYCVSNFARFCDKRDLGAIDVDISETEADKLEGNKIDEYVDKRYLEIDEFKQLLKSTEKLRDKILLKLMWDTGVRAQEAVDIKIQDIERDERKIEVENAKESKLKSSTKRSVWYTKRFDLMLSKYLDKGYRDSYMYDDGNDEGHLLVTHQRPRMAVTEVNRIFRQRAEEAGIQEKIYTDMKGEDRYKYSSHCLRHSFTVHRVKNGCPIVYLQDLLNHADIAQTRKYLQFREDDLKEAYDKYSP